VSFLDVEPDTAQLTTDVPPIDKESYLELPSSSMDIQRLAEEVAGTGSTYQKAIALQDYFTGGEFT
jgi:hypothetical protein